MTREEVKKAATHIIYSKTSGYGIIVHWELAEEIAEAILNLGLCHDCEGSGKEFEDRGESYEVIGCHSCKGTGGEKMLKTQEDCDKCHEIRSVKV